MNGRERVHRAIRFEGPDRVPTLFYRSPGAVSEYGDRLDKALGKQPPDFSFTHYDFADEGHMDVGRYEDPWGIVWENVYAGLTGIPKFFPLEDWQRFGDYRVPDPADDPVFDQLQAQLADADGESYTTVGTLRLFEIMQDLRGFENLMVDLAVHADRFHVLARTIVDYNLSLIDRWVGTTVDEVVIGDDWGTQDRAMISPRLWHELFEPCYTEMCDAIHRAGKSVQLHSDGYILELLPHMISCGFDVIHCQVGLLGLEDLARDFGGKVCFRADLDRQHILPLGTPAQVDGHVREVVEKLGTFGGGLIGYGMIGPDVPLANIEAMCEAFWKYGRYPISR